MKRIDRVKAHEKEIDKQYKAIKRLQAKCKHKHIKKKYGGSTGNWDPNDNCYWVDIDCLDCKKHWSEDPNGPNYRT